MKIFRQMLTIFSMRRMESAWSTGESFWCLMHFWIMMMLNPTPGTTQVEGKDQTLNETLCMPSGLNHIYIYIIYDLLHVLSLSLSLCAEEDLLISYNYKETWDGFDRYIMSNFTTSYLYLSSNVIHGYVVLIRQ